MKNALEAIVPIKEACLAADEENLQHIGNQLSLCETLRDRIRKEIGKGNE